MVPDRTSSPARRKTAPNLDELMRRQRVKSEAGESFTGTGSRRSSDSTQRFRSGWVRDPPVPWRENPGDPLRRTPSSDAPSGFEEKDGKWVRRLDFSLRDGSPVPYPDYDDAGDRSTAADEGDACGGAYSDEDLPCAAISEVRVKDAEQALLLRVEDFCRSATDEDPASAGAEPGRRGGAAAPFRSPEPDEKAGGFWSAIWYPRAEGPMSRMSPTFYGRSAATACRWGSQGWPRARDVSEEAQCLDADIQNSQRKDLDAGPPLRVPALQPFFSSEDCFDPAPDHGSFGRRGRGVLGTI